VSIHFIVSTFKCQFLAKKSGVVLNMVGKQYILGVVVFNATFNNISVISRRSILLVEETRLPGVNHRPAASHWQTASHNVVSITHCLSGIRTHKVIKRTTIRSRPWQISLI